MSVVPIESVADTAFWVATYRANEGDRPDALFHDPLAARLVEGRGRAIAAQMPGAAFTEWAVVLRTCIIDDFLREAIADSCDTVLNLGAGLDTRPYRMDLPPSLRWIEVDFPTTIDFKEQRLAGETPRCQLSRVRLDLGDGVARRALFEEVAARAQKVFVLTEGVVPYLSNGDVAALATDLHAQTRFAFWVLEFTSPRLLRLSRFLRWGHRRYLANAPIQFSPTDWNAFFAARGWAPKIIRSLAEEGRRRNRPFPLPRWARLLMRILRRGRRRSLQHGYVLMVRGSA
jgi:methyltransferase (TIGR00027 family)